MAKLTEDLFGGVKKSASISACGTYRYRLTRHWGPGATLSFVMLNPSTADADIDDPTIRRCIGFARREGAGAIAVVNLFAYRATDPAALAQCNDPFGPGNAAALSDIALEAKASGQPIVCAWGANAAVHNGYRAAIDQFERLGVRLVALGVTKEGHPRHPLYVKADQPFVAFPAGRAALEKEKSRDPHS